VKTRLDLRRWTEVSAAFEALVELDEHDRSAELERLCSSDAELHAAVDALLTADLEAENRLASLETATRLPAPSPDPLRLTGRTVSHFQVAESIGAGGMGVVYRAVDTNLGRAVALKLLLPAYNVDKSARARFLREGRSAAALDHPNLCAVYEVGISDDGWMFLAMPLYEGETLRNRLDREGRLPVAAILAIGRQIAVGLQAAHAAGIVHRDLKPGNVMLLPDDNIRILDFGLAKARDQSVTDSGAILGTTSYMAPEQIRGDAVDVRADLWALGVVFYQMLTGRKPFAGEKEVAIAHAILHDDLPPFPVDVDAPVRLKNLVVRMLEKDPKDRPQSATEIVEMLDAVNEPIGNTERLLTIVARKRIRPRVGVLLVSVVAITLVILSAWWERPSQPASDERLVAVLPFRVGGADPSLRYMREGIIDLLAAKLTGTTRVADARLLLPAWRAAGGSESSDIDRDGAIKLGDQLGAQSVLLGEVTGSGERVTIHASLVNVDGGESRNATVEGRQDSVLVLVDRLAVQLLAFRAGADVNALGDLGTTSFAAMRDYLEGQRLTRLGQYQAAGERYRAAAKADSNFAAAWFGVLEGWWGASGIGDTASQQLLRLRDRLTPAMRAMVDARMGPHYPIIPTIRERYLLAQRATQIAPADPYTWDQLGDVLFHWGEAVGVDSAPQRSIAAFERALAIDSSAHTAMDHLAWLYYERGDTAATRRWLKASVGKDTSGRNAYVYLGDVVLHDARSAAQWRAAIRDDFATLEAFVFFAEDLALPLAPLDSVMTAFATRRSVTDAERAWSTWRAAGVAHIRGHPNRQAKLLRSVPGILRDDWPTHILVLEAVLDDADSTLGEQARRTLDGNLTLDCLRPFICSWFTAGVYDLMRGNPQTARMAVQRFRAHNACWAEAPSMCAAYALILEAMLAAADSTPDARAKLVQVDSMLRDAPVNLGPLIQAGNLIAARLWERSGDLHRALAAVRRRVRLVGGPELYATYLREEGRLATATGDREGAARAYRRYLTLRDNAEPSLQPQVVKVRTDLARIERERIQ
jgi:serine/threonine protein kinase/tetratricopeptide (TPR) repeat protein